MRTKQFLSEGVTTRATISRLFSTNRHGRTDYVAYRYTASDGIERQDEDAYPFADWNILKPGDAIDIVYLASEPGTTRIARRQALFIGDLQDTHRYRAPALLALAGVGLMGLYMLGRRAQAKQ